MTFGADPDPHLWLMDQAPDPDPTLDPTPFFSDFKGFGLKFCVKILFCKHYFRPLNTFMRKEKEMDPEKRGPKTCGWIHPYPQHCMIEINEIKSLCQSQLTTGGMSDV